MTSFGARLQRGLNRILLVGIVLALVAQLVPAGVVGSHTPAHNTPPDLAPIADVTSPENAAIAFSVSASDADGDDLNIEMMSALPAGAQFWQDTPTTGMFTWTPSYSQAGIYEFSVRARDEYVADWETFEITVTNVNRAPDFPFLNDEFIDELEQLHKEWYVTDPDGDPVTLTLESDVKDVMDLPAGMGFADSGGGRGALTWTPDCTQGALPWPGEKYHFWANATDGSASTSREFDIWVQSVNTAPEIIPILHHKADEGDFLSFTINVTSCEPGEKIYAEIGFVKAVETGIVPPPLPAPWPNQALPVGVTIDPELPLPMKFDPVSGHNYTFFNWTIHEQQAGNYTFYAHVVDEGGLEDNATFQIFVNQTNTPPMILLPAFHVPAKELYYSKEDTKFYATLPLNLITDVWTAFGADLEDDIVEWELDWTDVPGVQLPPGMTISKPSPPVPASATFFTISWTPGYTQAGNYSFELSLTDFVDITVATFNISVENTNRLPRIDLIPDMVIPEDELLEIRFQGQELDFKDPTYPDFIELSADDCFGGPIPAGSDFHDPHDRQDTYFHGVFRWEPSFFQSGSYCVRFFADDSDSDVVDPANPLCCPLLNPPPSNPVESLTITVLNVDRAPKVDIPCAPVTVKYGTPILTSFKFSDPDFDPILLSIDTTTPLPAFLGLIDLGTGVGSLSGTPALADIGKYTIRVNATSGPLSLVAQTTCRITVVAEADFRVEPVGSNIAIASPGDPLTLSVKVTNELLSGSDTFTFTTTVSEGGSATTPSSITLGPGASGIVTFDVTVPAGEPDFVAKLFATSTLDLSHTEQAGFIVRVPVFTSTVMTNTLPLPSVTGLVTLEYANGDPAVGVPVAVTQTPSLDPYGKLSSTVDGLSDASGLFAFDFGMLDTASLPGEHDLVVVVEGFFGGPETGSYNVPV